MKQDKVKFDPNKPFEVVEDSAPVFDPSKPFEVVDDEVKKKDEVGEEVSEPLAEPTISEERVEAVTEYPLSFREEEREAVPNYMGLFDKKDKVRQAQESGVSVSFAEQAGEAASRAERPVEYLSKASHLRKRLDYLKKNFTEAYADLYPISEQLEQADSRTIDDIERQLEFVESKIGEANHVSTPEGIVNTPEWEKYRNEVIKDPVRIAIQRLQDDNEKLRKAATGADPSIVGEAISQLPIAGAELVSGVTQVGEAVVEGKTKELARGIGAGLKKYAEGYSMLIDDLKKNKAVRELIDKKERIEKGGDIEWTTEDRLLAKALVENLSLHRELDKEIPAAYRIGEATGQSVGFMLEFGLLGAPAKAVAAPIWGIKAGTRLGRAGVSTMAKLAEAGIRTTTMPTFYKTAAENVSHGMNVGEAFLHAGWEVGAEVGSELLFMGSPVGKVAGKSATDILRAAGINFDVDKGAVGVFRNILEEATEEKISEIMTAPKDYDSFKEFWDGFTDREQNKIMLGSVALMTGGMGSVALSGNKLAEVRRNARINRVFKDVPKDLREEIDVVTENKDLTLDQKYALIGDAVSYRIDTQELGEDPATVTAKAMQYTQLKVQQSAAESVDENAVVKDGKLTIGEVEEVENMQQQLDYLIERDIDVEGLNGEQVEQLYEKTKEEEDKEAIDEAREPEVVKPKVAKPEEKVEVLAVEEMKRRADEIREANKELDAQISEAQQRLELPETPDVEISDDTEVTLDKIENNEPVTNEFLNRASSELKEKYDELEAMKLSETRVYTTDQIESMQEFIGEEITNLENYAARQKEAREFVPEIEAREVAEKRAATIDEKLSEIDERQAAIDAEVTRGVSDARKEELDKEFIKLSKERVSLLKERKEVEDVEKVQVEKVQREAEEVEIEEPAEEIPPSEKEYPPSEEAREEVLSKVREQEGVDVVAEDVDLSVPELSEKYDIGTEQAERVRNILAEAPPAPVEPITPPKEVIAPPIEKVPEKPVKTREERIKEADDLISSGLSDIADIIGVKKTITGEERAKLVPAIKKVAEGLVIRAGVTGQDLVNAIKKQLEGYNVDEDLIKQSIEEHAEKIDALRKESEEAAKREAEIEAREPIRRVREVDRPEAPPKKEKEIKAAEKKYKNKKSRAGIRYAFGENFSEKAKEAYREGKLYEYTPESHEETALVAQSIFELNPIDVSERVLVNKEIPRRVRVGVGLLLARHYSNMANVAAREGRNEEADQWADQSNETFKSIQDDIAIESGRDISFFGSEFVSELLTPYNLGRQVERGFDKQRKDIEKSDMYKRDVSNMVKKIKDLRKDVVREIEKDKKIQERKAKAKKKKEEVSPEIQKIRDKRANLRDKLKNAKTVSGSVVGLSNEQIEIGTEIALTYIQEGVVNVKQLIQKLKKEFKTADIDIADDQAREMLPKEIDGKKITDVEKEQALEKAAEELATKEFGDVLDKKAPKKDPMKQMVDTLIAKFRERAKKGDKPAPRSNMDVVKEAILNRKDYMGVWKEARDKAIKMVQDMDISHSEKMKYSKRINEAYEKATKFTVSEKRIQQLIRESLKERDISIDDVVRGHYEREALYLEDLKRDLIEKSGLTEKDAKELAEMIDNAFNTLMTVKGEALVNKYVSSKTKKREAPAAKGDVQKLIELVNIGAFDSQEFRDVFAKTYEVPELSKEMKDYIVKQAKLIQKTKAGITKDKLEKELMAEIINLKGFDAAEYMTALWYAHILSGMSTHIRNILDATTSMIVETLHMAGLNRADARRAAKAQLSTFRGEGWARLVESITEGVSTNVGKKYVDLPSILERGKFTPKDKNAKAIADIMNFWKDLAKYVPRALQAPDSLVFSMAKESIAQILTSQAVRREMEIARGSKLNKKERELLQKEVDERLYLTDQQRADIREQVEEESKQFEETQRELDSPRTRTVGKGKKKRTETFYGYTEREKKLREYEIIDELRGLDISDKTMQMAGRILGNTEMYGTLGYTIESLSKTLKGYTIKVPKIIAQKEKGRIKFTQHPTDFTELHPAKFIMPFTNIVANVATRNLGWTTVGSLVRAIRGEFGALAPVDGKWRVEMSPEERKRLWQKVAKVGIFHATMYILMAAQDEDDPWLEITLNGTGNYEDNKELYAAGWRPYSIRLGNFSMDYRQLGGLAALLMPLGYINDKKRYTDTKLNDLELYAASTIITLGHVLKATPFYGFTKAMDMANYLFRGNERAAMKKLGQIAGGIGTGFVSPRALKELEDLARFTGLLEKDMVNPESFIGRLLQYVPFAGRSYAYGRIAFDPFGNPIETKMSTAAIWRIIERDPDMLYYINQGYDRPAFDMGVANFELFDKRGNEVIRPLNPTNKKEVALANMYDMMVGKEFERAVKELKADGYKGEEFVEEMEKIMRKIQKDAKYEIKYQTEISPVEYNDDAIVLE